MLNRLMGMAVLILCVFSSADAVRAQTQFEMNQDAGRELRAAEAEMNKLVDGLVTKAKGKPVSVAKLKAAQSAWLAFRDAHLKAYWPSEEPGLYGTVQPMCEMIEMTRLTKARIAELRAMTSSVEGDVCACNWPN